MNNCFSQQAEFGEIYINKEDSIGIKLHIKEVLEIEDKSKSQIHDLIFSWFENNYVKKGLVYRYSMNNLRGRSEWVSNQSYMPVRGKGITFEYNSDSIIFTHFVKCDDCMATFKKQKKFSSGFYQMEFRIKDGRFQFIMFEFYDEGSNSNLEEWVLKNGCLINTPDRRLEAIETQFYVTKESLLNYIQNQLTSGKKLKNSAKENSKLDDW